MEKNRTREKGAFSPEKKKRLRENKTSRYSTVVVHSSSKGKVSCSNHDGGFTFLDNMAEWSKALRSGRSIFGCVGSNPTVVKSFFCIIFEYYVFFYIV